MEYQVHYQRRQTATVWIDAESAEEAIEKVYEMTEKMSGQEWEKFWLEESDEVDTEVLAVLDENGDTVYDPT